MHLIDPSAGKPIPGLKLPNDFYWMVTTPAPLAGMRLPQPNWPWTEIEKAGFTRVVSLHPAKYEPTPLVQLRDVNLEDLVHGGPPANADAEIKNIDKVVTAILDELHSKQGVVVHCWGGRGRTGTVIGCVLRNLGFAADEIVSFLDHVHKSRGKPGWPESPWQSALVRDWPNR